MHRRCIVHKTHRFCGIRCLTLAILSSTSSVSPVPGTVSVDTHLRQSSSCEAVGPHLPSLVAPTAMATPPECILDTPFALSSTASFLCAVLAIFSRHPAILGANRSAELQSILRYVWQPSACTPGEQFPVVYAPNMDGAAMSSQVRGEIQVST